MKSRDNGKSCLWIVIPRGVHLPLGVWPKAVAPRKAHMACVEAEHSCTAPEVLPLQGRAQVWCPGCTGLPNLCCHMPPSQGCHPTSSSKNPWWNRTLWGFLVYFFLNIGVLLKPSEPLYGAQFHTQDYLKTSSNSEWESTKGMHMFCLQDSDNICVPNMEFCSFFSSLITQAGQGFQMEYERASTERSRLYYISFPNSLITVLS